MHPVCAKTLGIVLRCGDTLNRSGQVHHGLGRAVSMGRVGVAGFALSAVLVAGPGAGPGKAGPAGPVDLPPDGFGAMQYVDSAGCVYQRRTLDDPWQVRLNRDQLPLCGYEPTFAGASVDTAPVADAPAVVADVASHPGGDNAPRLRLAAPALGAILTRPGARALPPRIVSSQLISAQITTCPVHVSMGPAVLVRSYQLSDGRAVLRCGPQSADSVDFINHAGIPGLTVAGVDPAMQAMPATGRMMAALARALPNDGMAGGVPFGQSLAIADLMARARAPVAPQPGTRYVQIGAFAQLANVERIATALAAMGLPVRIATIKIRGKDADLISAGPILAKDAPAALRRVHAAGYRDAILR